jgi:hypothetical protein
MKNKELNCMNKSCKNHDMKITDGYCGTMEHLTMCSKYTVRYFDGVHELELDSKTLKTCSKIIMGKSIDQLRVKFESNYTNPALKDIRFKRHVIAHDQYFDGTINRDWDIYQMCARDNGILKED